MEGNTRMLNSVTGAGVQSGVCGNMSGEEEDESKNFVSTLDVDAIKVGRNLSNFCL